MSSLKQERKNETEEKQQWYQGSHGLPTGIACPPFSFPELQQTLLPGRKVFSSVTLHTTDPGKIKGMVSGPVLAIQSQCKDNDTQGPVMVFCSHLMVMVMVMVIC